MSKKKSTVVAVKLKPEVFDAMEDACIEQRIRRNSEFLRAAVLEKLERHGKIVTGEVTESE